MTCRGGEGSIMGLELAQESGGAAINLVSSGSRCRGGAASLWAIWGGVAC